MSQPIIRRLAIAALALWCIGGVVTVFTADLGPPSSLREGAK